MKKTISVLWFVLPLAVVAAPDFGRAFTEARQAVDARRKLEEAARAKAAQEARSALETLAEAGGTFGLYRQPLVVGEKPAIDAQVMAAAKAKIRAALPEKLTVADEERYDNACLDLECRAGDRAGREEVLKRLMARTDREPSVRSAMGHFRRTGENRAMLAFADRVVAANRGRNEALYALGLGWRWTAAARLGEDRLRAETKALVEALPWTVENVRNTYLVFAGDGSRDPKDFERLLRDEKMMRASAANVVLMREILNGAFIAHRFTDPDYRRLMAYLDETNAIPKSVMGPFRVRLADELVRMRCWTDASRLAEEILAASPDDVGAAERAVTARLGAGRRTEIGELSRKLADNGKLPAAKRFIARVGCVLAAAKTPDEVTAGVLALEKESGAKDGREFADFVAQANLRYFHPLATEAGAPWVKGLRNALLALGPDEEEVVHTVRFRPAAPDTAAGAEAAGLFDPGWFADHEVEKRFAPQLTYGWTYKRNYLKSLKCDGPKDLVGVKGEGRSAELVTLCDKTGVHVYTRFRDPSAAKFALGESTGAGYEFSVMFGEHETGWHQVFVTAGSRADAKEVEWESFREGHHRTLGNIVSDSSVSEEAYLFHTFIPWSMCYTRLPKDGTRWLTVMCAGLPSGFFVLGGGDVHEFGRGMRLRFALSAEEETEIRRAVLRRGAGDFLRTAAKWENAQIWSDAVLGDPKFYGEVLKPWLDERLAAARALIRRDGASLTDAEAEELERKYLCDWFDTKIRIDRLRAKWLEGNLL